jgi:hypothetical protein
MADDPTAFKFVVLDTNTDAYCSQKLYYSWDATAHTGKFLANNSDSSNLSQYVQNSPSTVGGIMYGWVSARFMMLFSRVNSVWGDPNYAGPTLVAERSRMWPLDTVAAGVPPVHHFGFGWMMQNSSNRIYAPLKQTRTGGVVSGATAAVDMYVGPWGWFYNHGNLKGQFKKTLNASGQSSVPIFPILLCDPAESGMPYGSISEGSGIYAVPGSILGTLETITYNGITYNNVPVRQNGDDLGILVRRG